MNKRYLFYLLMFTLGVIPGYAQISDAALKKINDIVYTSPGRAKKSSDSLLQLYPKNYTVVNIAGNVNWAAGDYNNATRLYLQSLQLEPRQMTAYRRMAQFFSDKGMYDKALEYLDKGIELKPDPALYSERALVYMSLKNYAFAKRDDEEAIKLKNDNIYNYSNAALSAFHLKEGNPTRYFEDAEKVSASPRPQLWLRRGVYYAAGPGDYASAKIWFDKIFVGGEHPEYSASDLNLMGITYYKHKEYSGAEKMFNASLERREDPDVMGNLASVYVDQQYWNKLLTHAKKMVDKYPNDVMANGYYGVALVRTGQKALGEQYLKKAEDLQNK